MMANDEQYTPRALFDAMAVEFDLDVAAPKGGIPWIPAKAHYSIEDNALEKPWWGMVWMNPPYSKPSPRVACSRSTSTDHELTPQGVLLDRLCYL